MENSNKNLLININRLANTAKEQKWAVEYDADLDSLYWTKPVISPFAKLTKLSDESALYITPEGNIEGLFIEYAKNNFISHNNTLKPIFDSLTKSIDGNKFTIPVDKEKKVEGLLSLMADKVANESVAEILESNLELDGVFA